MQIKIYVVTTKLNSENSKLIKPQNTLIKLFSGLTETKNLKGFWINGDKVDKDRVIIWEILTTTKDFNKNKKEFLKAINDIKEVTKQKSQLYTINKSVKPIFV